MHYRIELTRALQSNEHEELGPLKSNILTVPSSDPECQIRRSTTSPGTRNEFLNAAGRIRGCHLLVSKLVLSVRGKSKFCPGKITRKCFDGSDILCI